MMKKRIFSLLLVVAMLMSILPVIANAADSAPIIKTISLTLESILELNVKVDPNGVEDMSAYKVQVTIGNDDAKQVIAAPEEPNSKGLYVFTAKLPAHRLPEDVKVELLMGEAVIEGHTTTWKLADYLPKVVEDDPYLSNLTAALENYGAHAAYYNDNGLEKPTAPEITVENLEEYKGKVVGEHSLTDAALAPTFFLYLDNSCDLRIKFAKTAWDESCKLYVDNELVNVADDGNYVVYEISEIRPQDWFGMPVFKVVKGEEIVLEYKYGVMSYVYGELTKTEESKPGLHGLVKSMYKYAVEAVSYLDLNTYTVTYNANYGDEPATKVDVYKSPEETAQMTVAANPFYRPGYKFTGWASYEPVTNYLLNEDFSDATALDNWAQNENGSTATEKWTVDAENGVLKYIGTQTANSALLSDTAIAESNYELTTTFYFPDYGAQFGMIFASDDAMENFHYFRVNVVSGGYYRLYVGHVKDGTLSGATTYQYSGAVPGATSSQYLSLDLNRTVPLTVKIVVDGTKFSIYGGDDLWLEADAETEGWTDLNGKVGIFLRGGSNATNYTFDDVCIKAEITEVTSHAIGDALDIEPNEAVTLYAQWESINVLLNEDFSTSDALNAWTSVNQSGQSGSWGIADGALQYTGEGANSSGKVLLYNTPINQDNYEITAKVKLYENTTGKSIGFVFGSNADASSFHYFRIWSNGNYIISAGSNSTLAGLKTDILNAKGTTGVSALSGQTVELKLKVEGQKFTIYVNGVEQQTGTTTAENLHGQFGVLLRGDVKPNAYDDIVISTPDILMDEDFNSMAAIPNAWTTVNQSGQSGNWGIADGTLQYTGEGTNGNGKVLLFDTAIAEDNYEITAKVKLFENTTGKSIGFVFGSNDDATSFHYFRIWSNGNYIISAGSESTLAGLKTDILNAKGTNGVNALSGTTIELKLRVEGNTIKIYVNGNLQQTGTTTAENLHGKFGVLLRGDVADNAYDDIMVEKITVTTAE